jgi:hypothetical protein
LASWTVLFPPQELGLPHGRLTGHLRVPDPGCRRHAKTEQGVASEN